MSDRYLPETFDRWADGFEREKRGYIKGEIDKQIAAMKTAREVFVDFARQAIEDRRDPTGKRQEKAVKLLADYEKKLLALRAAALEFINDEREKVAYHAINLESISPHAPVSKEEWQTASERAAFVKEDIESLAKGNTADLLRMYKLAVLQSDRARAWLIERYGPEALRAAGSNLAERKLREEINAAHDKAGNTERKGRIQQAQKFLDQLERDVLRHRVPSETDAIAERFGVKQMHTGKWLPRDLIEAGFGDLQAMVAEQQRADTAIVRMAWDLDEIKKKEAEREAKAETPEEYDGSDTADIP